LEASVSVFPARRLGLAEGRFGVVAGVDKAAAVIGGTVVSVAVSAVDVDANASNNNGMVEGGVLFILDGVGKK
jgi:hypothetical protein